MKEVNDKEIKQVEALFDEEDLPFIKSKTYLDYVRRHNGKEKIKYLGGKNDTTKK